MVHLNEKVAALHRVSPAHQISQKADNAEAGLRVPFLAKCSQLLSGVGGEDALKPGSDANAWWASKSDIPTLLPPPVKLRIEPNEHGGKEMQLVSEYSCNLIHR